MLDAIIKNNKGSIFIETAISCLVLVIFLTCCVEIFTLITTELYISKVAREGGREASLTGSESVGKAKAQDVANQYLPGKVHPDDIKVYKAVDSTKSHVICEVSVDYRYLTLLRSDGIGGRTLNAQAVYPWWDENS